MSDESLDSLLRQIREHVSGAIMRNGNAFSTGFRLRSGRALGFYVESTQTQWLVSDGGDAWGDLVLEGYTNAEPSAADEERLDRACKMHRVEWDGERRRVLSLARAHEEIVSVVPRVVAAAMTIDGWAAWYPMAERRSEPTDAIIRSVERLAHGSGWEITDESRLRGSIHSWPVNTVLTKKNVRAAVQVSREKSAEHVIQRAVGFLHDVKSAGLVLAVSPGVAKQVDRSREFGGRVRAVALVKGAARAIVDAAEETAA